MNSILATIALLCNSGNATVQKDRCQKELVECLGSKKNNAQLWVCVEKRLGVKK